jgi:hypothetical protein
MHVFIHTLLKTSSLTSFLHLMTHTIESLNTKRGMSSLDCAGITLHFMFIYLCLLLLSLHPPRKFYSLSLGSHSEQWKGRRKYCKDSVMVIDDMSWRRLHVFVFERTSLFIHLSRIEIPLWLRFEIYTTLLRDKIHKLCLVRLT